MEQQIVDAEVVWRPDQELVRESKLAGFLRKVGIAEPDVEGYAELVRRSNEQPEWFWNQVLDYCDVRFYEPYRRVMESSRGLPWTQWCEGATTNLVLNCLDKHRGTPVWEKIALVWEGENGEKRQWTYGELDAHTSRLAAGLRARDYGQGDVIALYMPMVPEAAAALLAVAKIGAILLPLFSGFGANAIAARLNDAGATGVIAADGTWRRGKAVEMKTALDEALALSPTVRHAVILRNLGVDILMTQPRDLWWADVCRDQSEVAQTEVMPAEAPMMLMYTSGTTGKPKGTVHSHCGFTAKLALDVGVCLDYKADDRMMWMSDMGWVVGPILVICSTMIGATMVMAEGAPDYPDSGRYWRLIEENEVTFLGIAPTIVRSFMRADGSGVDNYDLSSLRVTVSTGEPWTPDAWTWMFERVCRRRVPILNYSGGTEVGGGILTGTVLHPLKPCAFGGPVPGMGADVVDEHGRSVGRGGVGELVMRQASIGLTRGLWRDPERYINSYWNVVPGLWWHGDRTAIDRDGYWYILGRSDDTLKIAGKRTGPSEIEALVMETGKVAEAAAIGVPDDIKGEAVALVVTPLHADAPVAELTRVLSDAVVTGLGTPFRPKAVLFVPDLPKTRNMKIMRRVVRAAYLGQPPGDLSSLVNPESIERIAEMARASVEGVS